MVRMNGFPSTAAMQDTYGYVSIDNKSIKGVLWDGVQRSTYMNTCSNALQMCTLYM